jgi:RHS repeat-associated protein
VNGAPERPRQAKSAPPKSRAGIGILASNRNFESLCEGSSFCAYRFFSQTIFPSNPPTKRNGPARGQPIYGIQAGTVLNYGYTHDGAGNVETISGLPKPDFFPRLADLTYNANRMATQNTDFISGIFIISPAAVYSYDAAGNIISDGLHTDYFHNQKNRLIRVEVDGLTVAQYAYDAFERRVMKVVNGVTTHFHYDLNGLLISETDGNGNPRKDYVYLNGEPVAMKTYGGSAGWYWFVNDHLGTPQKMVDAAGNVVWAAAYAPFGEARVYKDEVVNNIRFPGQYYDVETGLHYNWHRYYDPVTGRYLRADPIGLDGGVNLYAYSNLNRP